MPPSNMGAFLKEFEIPANSMEVIRDACTRPELRYRSYRASDGRDLADTFLMLSRRLDEVEEPSATLGP